MEEFGFLKSERLRRAFQLRKDGKPQEALVQLELACEENNDDGQSLYVKGDALTTGGFFLRRDDSKAAEYFNRSAELGCPWAMVQEELIDTWAVEALKSQDPLACALCYYKGCGVEESHEMALEFFLESAKQGNLFAMRGVCFIDLDDSAYWAQKTASLGDPMCSWRCGFFYKIGVMWGSNDQETDKLCFNAYLQGALQRHYDSCEEVAMLYESGKGCQKSLPKSAFFFLEGGELNYGQISRRLEAKEAEDKRERLQELFIYGQRLEGIRDEFGDVSSNCIRIYTQSVSAAKEAVDCFTLICKFRILLSKDVRRIIGEMIWDSRTDPIVWNIGLTAHTMKKIKRG